MTSKVVVDGATYAVTLESDESGGYTVWANALRGCVSEGDTWDEALENIKDAIQGWLAVRAEIERERATEV